MMFPKNANVKNAKPEQRNLELWEKQQKMITPRNTDANREILAKTILTDIPLKELRRLVLRQLMTSYKKSSKFIEDYNKYFEETGGHCPFGINSD